MSDITPQDRRGPGSGGDERRDHSPPGRLRRLAHDHGRPIVFSLVAAGFLLAMFVVSTAYAVNERFKRDVAAIAYSRDTRSLQFLLDQEAQSLAAMGDTVEALEGRVQQQLSAEGGPYIVVSLAEKRMWYLDGADTLFTAPVAVGSGQTLVMGGETKRFQTPRGRMEITHKERDPVWVPPDWHYHKIAQQRGLRLVNLSNAAPSTLTERGFAPGEEPIADGVVYIPPYGSPQRRHTGVLGVAKLEMQDGYYFHGTNNEASIGTAASAGCIRMLREDILWMYENVPVGTAVYIY